PDREAALPGPGAPDPIGPRASPLNAGQPEWCRRTNKSNDFFKDPAPSPTFTSIPVRGPGLA
ncbi:hypothetical protein, partial [Streptomyces mirabilis]|uniref:hypothetical protein n=1 Tax=Streptomyces mirabilis TaxID=68239 RepID=UPI00332761D7